jgi:hypothetical protein
VNRFGVGWKIPSLTHSYLVLDQAVSSVLLDTLTLAYHTDIVKF